jgi:hypothetical protein
MATLNQSDEKFCSLCDPSPVRAMDWCSECNDFFVFRLSQISYIFKHDINDYNHGLLYVIDSHVIKYAIYEQYEKLRGHGDRDRMIVWLTNCRCNL